MAGSMSRPSMMRKVLRVHPGSTPGSMPSASRNWINCLRRAVRVIGCSMKDSCPCLPNIGLHVAMWSMSGMLTETSRITSGYSLIHSRSRMNGFEDIRQRLKTVKATGWSPFINQLLYKHISNIHNIEHLLDRYKEFIIYK